MHHLAQPIEKLAKNYGLSLTKSFLGDLSQYLATGDERWMPRLLKIAESDMNKLCAVARAVSRPDKFAEADRRLLRFFARRSALLSGKDKGEHMGQCSDWPLGRCLEKHLENEKPNEDFCGLLRHEVLALGIPEPRWLLLVARHVEPRVVAGRLTSAGRYLASRPPAELVKVMPALRYHSLDKDFMPAFAREAPETLEGVMIELFRRKKPQELVEGGWQAALESDPRRFESHAISAFELMSGSENEEKAELARALEKHFPGKYRKQTMKAASSIGAALGGDEQVNSTRWLIEQEGDASVPAITEYVAKWNLDNPYIQDWKVAVLKESARHLGFALRPALSAAMQKGLPELRYGALELWIGFRAKEDNPTIEKQLMKELSDDDPKVLVRFIPLAATWDLSRVTARLWQLIEHKSKPVRETTAAALSKLGDQSVPMAVEKLLDRRADVRKAVVALLRAVGTEKAAAAVRSHLQDESSGEVKDVIKKMLAKMNAAIGVQSPSTMKNEVAQDVKPDQKQMENAIAEAAPKIKGLPADWIRSESLPALYFVDGKQLTHDAVRYLLHRQSREKEIAADSEASLLYAVLDRKRSGDFALALLNGYLGSELDAKHRWVLALAGLLGDDRIVPLLTGKIAEWAEASRGKLAEYAVQALALLATDAALLAVDGLAIRYRTKFKNIGKAATQAFAGAADARGLSPAELGDRVLPWLGFEPGKQRVFEFGNNRIEVAVGLDLKLAWRDLVKGKKLKTLPASAPAEIKAQSKELSAALKEVNKAQLLRMENLMVQQHRWPAERWAELFLRHPLIFPFAVRLVWGVYDQGGKLSASFRALEDHSLTNAADELIPLPSEGEIGIVHPLELTPEQRQTWLKHLADYEVVPPFAQLERPVVTVKPEQRDTKFGHEVAETEMNAMTFKGRAERLGWSRGSVIDAGGINFYHKTFPSAGVDVFLQLEGMYIGIDMYSDITLGEVCFVRHNSVQVGSYTYDEPAGPQDPRLVPFGEVPPIAFSEAMGDLVKVAGKSKEQPAEATDA